MKLLVSVSPRQCCMNVHVFSVTEIQTIEEGGNVNLTCGDRNHSSSTVLSWSKDGEDVLVNITSFNQSMLVLSNLERSGSGLYVCTANSSVVLRRVRLTVMKDVTPEQEETATPQEGLTRVDIVAIILGLALTAFLVVTILSLLYRAEKRRKKTKYVDRWQVDIQTQENMSVEELTRIPPSRRAFFMRTGRELNRPPPPYRKPTSQVSDSYGTKYVVDENANENNNDRILQWRFTAYL